MRPTRPIGIGKLAAVSFLILGLASEPLMALSMRSANRGGRRGGGRESARPRNSDKAAKADKKREAEGRAGRDRSDDDNVKTSGEIRVNGGIHANLHFSVDEINHGALWAGLGAAVAVGAVVASLPPQTETVVVDGASYHYAGGVYYEQKPAGYTVVNPPLGAAVHQLPEGSLTIVYQDVTYHYFNGTFYVARGDDFVVVNPVVGMDVPALPNGAVRITLGGEAYYRHGTVYYRPFFQNGETVYTVERY